MSTVTQAETVKQPRRKIVKPQVSTKPKKVKATISITADAMERLALHALRMGKDRSELVELLINTHLRRYVISDRGGEANGALTTEGE